MAGFLSLFNTPERIEVADGFWIDVKSTLSTEDYEYAQRALLGKMTMIGGGELRSEPDTIRYQQELVSRSIVAWNLTDEDGKVLPHATEEEKMESIRRIPQSVFVLVFQKVSDDTKPRSSDEELKFRSSGEVSAVGDGETETPVLEQVSD